MIDEEGRIVAASRAADVLLPSDAVGRPCHEVFRGADVFGNLFCRERCSLSEMARRRETPRYFEMSIRDGDCMLPVGCVTAVHRSAGSPGFRLLHVFHPFGHPGALRRDPASRPPRKVRLTRREREVLGMLTLLDDPGRIATALGIRLSTAKRHVRALQRKLGARGILETIYRAGERRLL